MKILIRLLSIALMCLMVLPLLIACGQTGDKETTDIDTTQSETTPQRDPNGLYFLNDDGEFKFTILRSDYATSDVSSASVLVAKAFRTALGIETIIPQTDYVKRGEEIPENEYEILIGDTNRKLSTELKATLDEDEYLIQVKNNCIIIVANSNRALLIGVEQFVELIAAQGTSKNIFVPKDLSIKGKYEIQHVLNEVATLIPTAKYRATALYMTNTPSNTSDRLGLATLQGLVCNLGSEQIFIKAGSYAKFLPDLEKNGVAMEETSSEGKNWDFTTLLTHFADKLDGYVLCENDIQSESARVAVCLSGVLNAVVITEENEGLAKKLGLAMKEDARGKDDAWLRASDYWNQLNRDVAVEQAVSMAPRLVDYAVMTHSYINFYGGRSQNEHKAMFNFLNAGASVLGYNNTLGEYDTVDSFSKINLQMVPSDHASNMSTYSGFAVKEMKQPNSYTGDGEGANKHTVVLIMSDGDNMQWFVNDYTKDKWYNSSVRGQFEMTWGLAPTAIDLTSPVLKYFFDTATPKDQFIMQLSGVGYTFPSRWDPDARFDMAAQVSDAMDRMGLKYMEILDDHGFENDVLIDFMAQDNIDGAFYIDFGNYAQYNGKIKWVHNKPVVSARYRLWAGLKDGDIDYIANKINTSPRDPSRADSYTFITVHAWSGIDNDGNQVEGGNCMAGVEKLVSKFTKNVEVVSVDEFMTRIIKNVQH